MSKLPIKDIQGAHLGEHDLADELLVFDKGQQVMHDAVVAHLANKRAGSAATLTKGEVSGSNRKPWRQKGLGRARSGCRRSPIWRGGGVVFGPKPRSYNKKMTKKAARLAFRRAFSEKVAAGQVMILDDFTLTEPKTKLFTEIFKKLDVKGKTLVLVHEVDRNLYLASRNIAGIEVRLAKDSSTYDLLRYATVVITKSAMQDLEKRLKAVVKRGHDERSA